MFSPFSSFPVPGAELARLLDYQMNWLGWPGPGFTRPPPDDGTPGPEEENTPLLLRRRH